MGNAPATAAASLKGHHFPRCRATFQSADSTVRCKFRPFSPRRLTALAHRHILEVEIENHFQNGLDVLLIP
jgi:hypothetical protein